MRVPLLILGKCEIKIYKFRQSADAVYRYTDTTTILRQVLIRAEWVARRNIKVIGILEEPLKTHCEVHLEDLRPVAVTNKLRTSR